MTLVFPVTDSSQVDPALRAAAAHARRLGFDEAGTAKVAAVSGTMARALAEHATRGQFVVSALTQAGVNGLELLALDEQAGLVNSGLAQLDIAHECYSVPNHGTALLTRFWAQPQPGDARSTNYEVGAVGVPAPGESICGDSWCIERTVDRALIVLADGLGHGPAAHEAAHEAATIALAYSDFRPGDLMSRIHEGLRRTRGAAVAVVEVSRANRTVICCGVGNIAGMIVTPTEARGLVSLHGTAGVGKVRIKEFTYPFAPGALLVLQSDGLKTAWNLTQYPGLTNRSPPIIAAVLYRDFVRGPDDATVIVLRERQELPPGVRCAP